MNEDNIIKRGRKTERSGSAKSKALPAAPSVPTPPAAAVPPAAPSFWSSWYPAGTTTTDNPTSPTKAISDIKAQQFPIVNSIDNNKADRSGVEESLVEDSNKEIGSSISAAHVPNCYFSDLFDAALQEAQDSLNRC